MTTLKLRAVNTCLFLCMLGLAASPYPQWMFIPAFAAGFFTCKLDMLLDRAALEQGKEGET